MMNEEELKQKVVECLQSIYDPEIPVSIYELGLIYEINILPINNVQIVMTLTAPSCPAGWTPCAPPSCARAAGSTPTRRRAA